jgi:hypothetical protein
MIDPFHPLAQGLVGVWLFNEGGGNTLFDVSGLGNHGSLQNGPAWVEGRAGSSLSFDGINDYVDIGTSINMASWPAISVSAWVKYDSSGTDEHTVISNWDRHVLFRLEPSNDTVEIFLWTNTQIGGSFLDLVLTPNKWHHIVMTFDTNNGLCGYLDGRKSTTSYSSSYNLNSTASESLYIGNSPHAGTDLLTGGIDSVRIYSRALSAIEVYELYANPYAGVISLPWIINYRGQPWEANPYGGVGPWIIQPESIPSAEALGSPAIIPGTIKIQPSGIASAEALGEPTTTSIVIIIPQGISSGEALGIPQVLPGLVTIRPEGIASLEAFGIPACAIPTAALPLELQVALRELMATVILLPAPEVEALLRAAKAQVKLDG